MSADSKYQKLYKEAYQALIHDQLPAATQKINELAEQKPCDAHVRLLRGNIYLALSDFETALREYQLVLIFSCNPHLNDKAKKGIDDCCRFYQQSFLPIPQASSLHTLVSLPKFVPKPIHRIKLSCNQVVDLYNNIPQILKPIAINIHLTTKSYRNSNHGIWLERSPQGKYWLIPTYSDEEKSQDFLVPAGDIEVNFAKLKKLNILFDIALDHKKEYTFFLQEPGQLKLHSSGQVWHLQKKGVLSNQKQSTSYDKLCAKIKDLEVRIDRIDPRE